MNNNSPSLLQKLEGITQGYRTAQVLFTAVRLDLFQIIGGGDKTFDEIAFHANADARAIRILCDALVGMRLLDKHNLLYRNIDEATTFLTRDGLISQNAILLHNATLYEAWSQLFDVVKSGKPALTDRISLPLQASERSFAHAMASSGKASAKETAAKLDLSRVNTLLDIGGGPGIYAIEFARQYPNLNVVIFDKPEALAVAQDNINQARLDKQISVQKGDVFESDWGKNYDFVFLSNIIHMFSIDQNLFLVQKAKQALSEGGQIGIKDFFLDVDRTSPEKACLFAVNMLINTVNGDCYTVQETIQWLESSGFAFQKIVDLNVPSRMVLGIKKAGYV